VACKSVSEQEAVCSKSSSILSICMCGVVCAITKQVYLAWVIICYKVYQRGVERSRCTGAAGKTSCRPYSIQACIHGLRVSTILKALSRNGVLSSTCRVLRGKLPHCQTHQSVQDFEHQFAPSKCLIFSSFTTTYAAILCWATIQGTPFVCFQW
jgi:hypothetical protein